VVADSGGGVVGTMGGAIVLLCSAVMREVGRERESD